MNTIVKSKLFVLSCSVLGMTSWAVGMHGRHSMPSQVVSQKIAPVPMFAGSQEKSTRSIQIQMKDPFVFSPAQIQVKAGEVIKLEFRNHGKTAHEFMLAERAEDLTEHAEIMLKNPNMQHHDATAISLKPQEKGAVVVRFNRAGRAYFGCMMAGHYAGGMKGYVDIKVMS